MHKWFIAILIMALFPCSVRGQETELKSSKAKAAVREYERKLENFDKEFAKQLKDLEKSYQMKAELVRARLLSNLNEAMEEEAKKVNVEEASKIRGMINVTKETELPNLSGLMEGPNKKTTKRKIPKLRIPKAALKFNEHHYAICTEPMTWHQAKEYCQAQGGQLASINTKQEFNFLDQAFFQRFSNLYLDGTDEQKEDEWVFSNGRKVDFSNIPVDRTKISGVRHRHHLAWYKGIIRDDPPGFRLPFIIEWDK